MDASKFDRSVGDLTAALGDSTRRGIYMTVRDSDEPMTAMEISDRFDIHPNVARHHLDRLASDGYLDVSRRRRSGKSGPGAGRPAKCYTATDKEIAVQWPPRRHDLLAELMLQVVERVSPDEAGAIAEDVGRNYGRKLAVELGVPAAQPDRESLATVAAAMTELGFDTVADPEQGKLVTCHCPFGEQASAYEEIVCRLDQGIVRGMLEDSEIDPETVVVGPRSGSDGSCICSVGTPQ